ncbi:MULTISPECIES: GGDEF domain-containing protein [unclassified Rhizobium]|uniref:GGDEF domain-containing protein n=1 Tax=unclassified Rhizobium TaxID=2613769 RepID=UPI00071442AA|nr:MULTISPECIES: sensor domain-containing diguanylate cyclase [unclassified Rhizobium]KQS96680.1 deoxycytidine triphosphate deaminase [Rhizobium sp. Leaf386]KQT06520.1 deoxycytidine triphosphate deaminase [Rhizobium sp. Leaf391]KQT92591.1 deoxycytidine triphosphate deaminase [Rhizobium sp. Leaf453]
MSASPSLLALIPKKEIGTVFSREQLYFILSALPDPAFILTESGRYGAIFGGADHRYYHDGSSLVGQTVFDVLNVDKAQWFINEIRHALATRALHIVEYSLAGSDVKGLEDTGPGHPIWFEGRIQALDFAVDGEEAVVWVASNITERNVIETQLRLQSETDALTGLFNRRKLIDVLDARFQLFQQDANPTVALMFDVDNFKTINDVHGHPEGDKVLVSIANTCKEVLRGSDFAARLGGDEFVILMPLMARDQGLAVADRLRRRISADLTRTLNHPVTISGGLSEFTAKDIACEEILQRADDGLYRSKRAGRDRLTAV